MVMKETIQDYNIETTNDQLLKKWIIDCQNKNAEAIVLDKSTIIPQDNSKYVPLIIVCCSLLLLFLLVFFDTDGGQPPAPDNMLPATLIEKISDPNFYGLKGSHTLSREKACKMFDAVSKTINYKCVH